MQAKSVQKSQAIKLRQEGYSLNEISRTLNVAKSTASLWLRSIELTEEAQVEISRKRSEARLRTVATRRAQTDKKIDQALEYGTDIIRYIKLDLPTTQLVCALLYWCEGAKIRRGNTFAFTNSDPYLVETFMRLFRKGFDVDEKRLRLNLHVHDYHDQGQQLQFWSKLTNIPLTQCHKPYQKPHTGKRTREGYQGCVSIRYHDVELARRLEGIAMAFIQKKGL